ncbi:MAG: hypothetical protein KAY32_02905 [Candidatus Eisenbacteria sp.]|nr:hypothetical protein [Candidatus Eisenbacteria bacterium]
MVARSHAARYLREMALAMELLGEAPGVPQTLSAAARQVLALSAERWRQWVAGNAVERLGLSDESLRDLGNFARHARRTPLDTLQLRIPPGLYELLGLPGLGPQRVRRLWHEAQIVSVKQLHRACRRRHLAGISGFGPGLEARFLDALEGLRRSQGRWLRNEALRIARRREAKWRPAAGLDRLAWAGEARRAWETVGLLTWVAAAANPEAALGRLSLQPGARLAGTPPDRVVWTPPGEPRQEVIVVEAERFAARWFLETGDPAHTTAFLQRLAEINPAATPLELGLPTSEEDLYAQAELPWIPPALREGRGEIAAAAAGRLPTLIRARDLRGVFHVHTEWSDGRASIAEVASAGARLGWDYIGIADHSQSAYYARGLTPERLAAQAAEVRRVAAGIPGVRLFHGVECDILPDGSLDYTDAQLRSLDYVIASIHSVTAMSREAMTARVVRALRHPAVRMFAHPSGRLLLQRPACALDWPAVFGTAAEMGVAIEFNTTPDRLDLDWRLIRTATEQGVRLVVNPDAHRLAALEMVGEGLETATKGWLTPEQVINTRSAEAMEDWLHATRSGSPETDV